MKRTSYRIGRYWVAWRHPLAGLFVAVGIGAMQPAVALPKNTVVATIAVGELPQGMVITPNSQTIYVTNCQSQDVSVIDTATNTVTTSITLPGNPGFLAITPDGQTLFVEFAGNSGEELAVIATATNTVTNTVSVDYWDDISVSPDGTQLWVTDYVADSVFIIDPATFITLKIITLGEIPFYVQVAPDGKSAYVLGYTGFLSKIGVASQKIAWSHGTVAHHDSGFAITSDVDTLYVPEAKQSVLVFDAHKGSRKATIQVAQPKVDLGRPVVTPNGKFLYVPCSSTDVVTMVRTADNKVTGGDISVGVSPFLNVVAPNGNYLYVLNGGPSSNGSVSVVDISE
jgi:YVTN family beta-propeller protein